VIGEWIATVAAVVVIGALAVGW